MIKNRTLRLIVASTLLALLVSMFMVVAASAHAVAPTHGVTYTVAGAPNSGGTPNSNIVTKHKKDHFKPAKLACTIVQGQACNSITNKTKGNVDIYLNGSYFFSQTPGQVNDIYYGGAGTYVYTIPNQNPKTKLTVTVS